MPRSTGRDRDAWSCESPSRRGPCVRVERGAQGLGRVVKARLGRPDRDPDGRGGFVGRHAEVVMQDDDRPVLDRQSTEHPPISSRSASAALESGCEAIGTTVRAIRSRRRFRASSVMARRRISSARRRTVPNPAAVADHASSEQGLPERRPTPVVVPEDQSRHAVHGVDGLGDEDVVRVPVPVLARRTSSVLATGPSSMSTKLCGRSCCWRDPGVKRSKEAQAAARLRRRPSPCDPCRTDHQSTDARHSTSPCVHLDSFRRRSHAVADRRARPGSKRARSRAPAEAHPARGLPWTAAAGRLDLDRVEDGLELGQVGGCRLGLLSRSEDDPADDVSTMYTGMT